MSVTTINPANNQELRTYQPLTREEVFDAIGRADEAFSDWRQTSLEHRKELMLKVASELRAKTDEFAQLITTEMGKRIREARGEITFCAEIVEFYANGASEFLSDHEMEVEDAEAYIQYAPIGALMGVMPWNFPFYQVIRFAAPNIMAGNTVLVKHASIVAGCAERIEQLFRDSGLPEGVFTNLIIPSEFVDTIIADDRIAGASLTGSEKAGAAVAAQAGKNLKRSVLELGGNDPFIVLEDADLENAVAMAVKGRMVNTGQSCVASKRFIVVEDVAEEFVQAFKEQLAGMKLGDPMDEETDLGPLSSEDAAQRLDSQVQEAVNAGATVLLGGNRPERAGAWFNPTILTDISPGDPTFDQELFGPVATIYRVKDEEEAISLANNSSFGLGGSVYTKDIERAKRVAEQIDTGMVFINQPTNSQAELPFGGTKNSGYGRELSRLGILEFVNKKLIHHRAD
ncbi:NAD-dependent succinate-semialdehyde dehydrogenase [Roseibacillus persicicus]|uniref:NAD-dependent succinate-semialdehyde dehydrogenase n=1 Tax=Roseibacillus persicicus TaxID=454148 RepID=UPI00398B3C62